MPRTNRSENYTWGEIFDSFKRGVIGSEDDFDDDDFEEVEEAESARPTDQAGKKTKESANPAQESTPKPAKQETDKGPGSVFCSSLQTDLNTFVQTGTVSDPLLQLLKEGFDKNPDLLEEIAKYIAARRRGEERIHPGYLVSYKGERSMYLTKEKALDHLLSCPGAAVRETIFVSLVKDGTTISTREATAEEKKLYFEQKSFKADASGQEGQDY
jgi:hypothetical protein